ncbi:LuxR C-terminal-related transcriptional regulator [Dactylosporangium sp. CA-139066]|uniref:LuxR C-terminal-related transcriptional regulator n=1 Tax=Dactylosporangium sp. CA-139066 TaxID=3239930 RepID=UPI003D940753
MDEFRAWRILLADDHLVVRAGLRALLAADPRCRVEGEAAGLDELCTVAHRLRPDLIVLDLSFGPDSALPVLPRLLANEPPPRIVVLTMHDDVSFAREAFAAGVHAYVLKEAAADELLRAVETVMGGSVYVDTELGARLARSRPAPADALSPRERDVLTLLAGGHTNAEIAQRLSISLRTVETHRANLRARLGTTSRAELVAAARRIGLLP